MGEVIEGPWGKKPKTDKSTQDGHKAENVITFPPGGKKDTKTKDINISNENNAYYADNIFEHVNPQILDHYNTVRKRAESVLKEIAELKSPEIDILKTTIENALTNLKNAYGEYAFPSDNIFVVVAIGSDGKTPEGNLRKMIKYTEDLLESIGR